MNEIEFHTRVNVPAVPFGIDYATGILSLGSCFSDEIARLMRDSDFHIDQNPFGTLYNPASIASALRRLMYDIEIGPDDLVEHEGLWHSWHHHGSFSRPTAEECLDVCNNRIHLSHQSLKSAALLIITFGSAWTFLRTDGRSMNEGGVCQVVANCHKLPQDNFVRRRMSVDDIVGLWRPLLDELHACFPTLNVLFTVSPIRHIGDGAHGNQLSKSTLLLAIDELVDRDLPPTPRKRKGVKVEAPTRGVTAYFPAYEIVLDELRDYRFFDADMAHPSPLAVEVVWDRFQRATMNPAIRDQAHFNRKQHKREQHVPLRR
ncbi:MAG: GSCFA domain-containing protein [Bacteroidales bacterium]|nr:GSCFA domain-containing protein [Bacteroidales bacterium]